MPGSATIGEARIDDVDAIMRVMEEAFDPQHGEAWTADQCRASFLLPGYHWLIATPGLNIAGFLLSRTVSNESEMMLLAVDVYHRGAGIGRALVDRWLSQCKADGVERAYLEVRDGNSALDFYRCIGFVEIGRREAYYAGCDDVRSDAITMTLALD